MSVHGTSHRRLHTSFKSLSPTLRLPPQYCYRSISNTSSTVERSRYRSSRTLLLIGAGACFSFIAGGTYVYFRYFRGSALNPGGFTAYTLVSKEAISSTSSVFTLRPTQDAQVTAQIYDKIWREGIWSVQVKQPQLQIARSYTPLPPASALEDVKSNDLRFLIRIDPQGEVSGYLQKLPVGAKIELRGPQLEYAIPNDVDEVLFLAGGTGIAPALQVVYNLLALRSASSSNSARIRILWANKRQEDALGVPRSVLQRIAQQLFSTGKPRNLTSDLARVLSCLQRDHQGELSLEYFIDEQGSFINRKVLEGCFHDSATGVEERLKTKPTARKLILVSGPDGFVNHYAGPKYWQGGVERQGPLGGVLKKLNLTGWEVWKL